MGAVLSLISGKWKTSEGQDFSTTEPYKRQRMFVSCYEENTRLIPSLPDEISIQIFARVPRISYFNMKLVARNWKAAVMSPELFNLRKELGTSEEWLYLLTKVKEDELLWHALDPRSRQWQRLPPMPNVIHEESGKGSSGLWTWNIVSRNTNITDVIRGWLGRKDASKRLPFGGCSTAAVDGYLYVIGGFSRASAMDCVWRYDPILNAWTAVASMSTGRAYCKAGALNDRLFVVGGVARGRGSLSPLQSAEVFDPCTGTWSKVPNMPFSKAQVLPAPFLAEMLKPIATGITPYKGKLYVPQSLYSWPFFVDIGGECYDPETNSWDEMPAGMGDGWPARQAINKLSVVVDEELYAFDPSTSLSGGKIKVYDEKEDAWKVVVEKLPCEFSESESLDLLAGFHGKLHFITKDENRDVAVLQADVHDNLDLVASTSSCLPDCCLHLEHSFSNGKLDTVIWKAIATRNFGSAELVDCQVLEV